MNKAFTYSFNSVANSYSQLFFSLNKWLALFILVATFFNPFIGLSGLLAVVFTNWLSHFLGLNDAQVVNGIYGYNALLVGLSIGFYFQANFTVFPLLIVACVLNLVLTITFEKLTDNYKIAILSAPFIITVWILLLTYSSYQGLNIKLNDFKQITNDKVFQSCHVHSLFYILYYYFKSLSVLFFQQSVWAGIVVATGLFVFSRIAFSFSLIGFVIGYLFTSFVGSYQGNIPFEIIGFNFILLSVAIGCYFVVPSVYSLLLVVICIPLIDVFTIAALKMFHYMQLPMFSLSFTLVTNFVLMLLKGRQSSKGAQLVLFQTYSPEENLYAHHNNLQRFKNETFVKMEPPFFGKWKISQGHNGNITHKDDYAFAWDFVVTNDEDKTYKQPGKSVTDFYCYNLPVLAPATGQVVEVIDGIDDNQIGDVNLNENWGNTIIIKHADFLFSKLSHIKKDSFKVAKGDHINKGDVVAYCGSSGRSPEPHLHFQLQTSPYLGAKSYKFPMAYYLTQNDNTFSFHSFENPKEGEQIMKVSPNKLINKAFHFIPGMMFQFKVMENGNEQIDKWEVFTDASNQSYIYCHRTKSYAYFTNNDTLFYFLSFSGSTDSLLYGFYLAAHKILQGVYKNLIIEDNLAVNKFFPLALNWIQDLIAPFRIFLEVKYSSRVTKIDDEINSKQITITSQIETVLFGKKKQPSKFEIRLENESIMELNINHKNRCVKAYLIKQ
jgi:urea transporter/murein DD-endopeptidase MepM/ murein hydrolase activator NlpD